ncbi:MAG: alpha/beta hydrolase [Novosphingobium sp. 16-62-11]|nr:MAG: alpha/beta hydrolase [Novosphingobium sp. 16-62-11]
MHVARDRFETTLASARDELEAMQDSALRRARRAAKVADQAVHEHPYASMGAAAAVGALIGMQLLMRRPEIRGFISVAPPANMYDFSFLAPCPASGIIVQGTADTVVTPNAVQKLVDKLRTQKHITIHHDEVPRANHFFENEMDDMMRAVDNYLDMRLSPDCPIR